MEGMDLIYHTLVLIKMIHENNACGANYLDEKNQLVKEQIKLAPKTLEQLNNALLEAEIRYKQELSNASKTPQGT